MSAPIKSGAIPAALAPRALRVGDVVRLPGEGTPTIITALTARTVSVRALGGDAPRTIPRPPIARVRVLGTTAPTSRRPRRVASTKAPESVEPREGRPATYGSEGLDLGSAF